MLVLAGMLWTLHTRPSLDTQHANNNGMRVLGDWYLHVTVITVISYQANSHLAKEAHAHSMSSDHENM